MVLHLPSDPSEENLPSNKILAHTIASMLEKRSPLSTNDFLIAAAKRAQEISIIRHNSLNGGAQRPIYLRLPKAGERCFYTGLTRSKLNSLILGPAPVVKSRSVKGRGLGAKRGVRLIQLDSL